MFIIDFHEVCSDFLLTLKTVKLEFPCLRCGKFSHRVSLAAAVNCIMLCINREN